VGTNVRAAISFRPAVVILLVCVLVLGCKKTAHVAKSVSHGPDLSLLVDEPGLNGMQVDSVYRQITPDIQATPALNDTGRWMIVQSWMRLHTMPDSLFLMDDMDRLEKAGRVSDSMRVAFVTYRYPVTAHSLDAVRESALARTQALVWPPARVREAMKAKR